MAHGFVRIATEHLGLPCPQPILDKWGASPIIGGTDDEPTSTPRTPENTTVGEVMDLKDSGGTSSGAAPTFWIKHLPDGGFERTDDEDERTHRIAPSNNTSGAVHEAMLPMAQAAGVPYGHLYVAHDDFLKYQDGGVL